MTGATGYNIMSSVNGGAFTKLNSSPVTATSFVDTTAPTGAAITYEVFAVNSGGVSSLPADASINLSSAVTPPSAPAFVQADGSSGTQVSLAWTAPAGATGYNLQREAPGQSSFTTIASDLTSASFSDLNVTAGATYTYQVQALNSAGASAFGAPVSVTVAQGVPPAPTNVQFSTTASSVVLTWAAASGATSYEVQRQNPGQSSYSIIASSLTGLTYTDTGVVAGKTYSYQIIAADAAGMSPPSSAVSATVPAAASTLIVTVGKAADSFVKFTTSGGAVVTITLNGPGAAAVSFTADSISQSASGKGAVLSGTNIAIAGIAITATTAGSSLSIATHGGSNSVNLGGITLGASMNAINAPTASLVGALTAAGSINRITFGSVVAAAMSIAGNLGTFRASSVAGASLSVHGVIGAIAASHWTSNQSVSATSINSITLGGSAQLDVTAGSLRSLHVAGTLHDSVLLLTAGGAQDLAILAAGAVDNTVIDTTGSIGTISASALEDSQIYAGIGASGAAAPFPPVSSAFAAMARISTIQLRKMNGVFSDTNSSIAASQIGQLNLGRVQFANGGTPFGVQAVSIKSLTAAGPSTSAFTFRNLTSQAIVSADFAAKKIDPQDFTIAFLTQFSGS